jgi:hypothetical protein
MTWHNITCHYVTWHDMMWHEVTWHDMISHEMTLREMMWHDITWRDVTWHHITWLDMTRHDMTWNDMTWRDVMWQKRIKKLLIPVTFKYRRQKFKFPQFFCLLTTVFYFLTKILVDSNCCSSDYVSAALSTTPPTPSNIYIYTYI